MSANSKTAFTAKRGRPKKDTVLEKGEGDLKYKCQICNRFFPRNKSLKAHLRIHNGERPYVCDYPNCSRAFCQSGQLRTHQRTHTREEVFACPYPGCEKRFIHTNRCCPLHPHLKLKRDGKGEICEDNPHLTCEEVIWLRRYKAEKENPAKRIRKDLVNHSPGINTSSEINGSDTNSLPDANSASDSDLEEQNLMSNFVGASEYSHSQNLQKEAVESFTEFISPSQNSSSDTNGSDTNSLPDANSSSNSDLEERNISSNFLGALEYFHSQNLHKEAAESFTEFISPGQNSSSDTNGSDTNSLPDANSSDTNRSCDLDLEERNIILGFLEALEYSRSQKLRKEAVESFTEFISRPQNSSPDTNSSDTNCLPDAETQEAVDMLMYFSQKI